MAFEPPTAGIEDESEFIQNSDRNKIFDDLPPIQVYTHNDEPTITTHSQEYPLLKKSEKSSDDSLKIHSFSAESTRSIDVNHSHTNSTKVKSNGQDMVLKLKKSRRKRSKSRSKSG